MTPSGSSDSSLLRGEASEDHPDLLPGETFGGRWEIGEKLSPDRARFRTIVADPPWPIGKSHGARTAKGPSGHNWSGEWLDHASEAPYEQMSVERIAAMDVASLAEDDAHLYLWTCNAFLTDAYDVARAWGFRPSTLLTWCKAPMGLGLGGAFTITTEFVLFARRGKLAPATRWDSTWFKFKRPYNHNGGPAHSAKPEGFLDIVEQVSPGPYAELFARRARLGWDYPIGDQALGGVAA